MPERQLGCCLYGNAWATRNVAALITAAAVCLHMVCVWSENATVQQTLAAQSGRRLIGP